MRPLRSLFCVWDNPDRGRDTSSVVIRCRNFFAALLTFFMTGRCSFDQIIVNNDWSWWWIIVWICNNMILNIVWLHMHTTYNPKVSKCKGYNQVGPEIEWGAVARLHYDSRLSSSLCFVDDFKSFFLGQFFSFWLAPFFFVFTLLLNLGLFLVFLEKSTKPTFADPVFLLLLCP